MADVWYHVYPLGFVGAPGENHGGEVEHRLGHLVDWVPHIAGLGATTLLLGPIFESSTHGYDTIDHLRVDRRLGDDADVDRLIETARDHGLRVVLDGVFNHVGRGHARFRRLLDEGPHGDAARWFRVHPDRDGPDGFAYDDFEGHSSLVALDHGEPEVLDHVVEVAEHWLDRGVAGWRLDAAYAVPTGFWRAFSERVKDSHPDAVLLGEVIHGDYGAFVEESGVDTVTQYELWKATWGALNDRNPHELVHALERHHAWSRRFRPLTFVGNHDVTRIATQLAEPRHLPLAVTVLMTVPGLPCVYSGDELGFTGEKRHEAGGDDDIRPVFPALPPTDHSDVLALHRDLIARRHENPWWETAELTVVEATYQELLVYRLSDGDHETTVRLNVADCTADIL